MTKVSINRKKKKKKIKSLFIYLENKTEEPCIIWSKVILSVFRHFISYWIYLNELNKCLKIWILDLLIKDLFVVCTPNFKVL